jgi:hypothetical protein
LRPHHVRTLEQYWVWLDSLVDQSSGWLVGNALIVRPLEPFPDSPPPSWVGLVIEQQAMRFGDDSLLYFSMVLDDDFVPVEYSFHYQDRWGEMIWRKCNKPGHDEGLLHIHFPPGKVEPFKQVDLEEVLGEVQEYLDNVS